MGNIFAARPIDNNSEATKFKQRNISTPIAIDHTAIGKSWSFLTDLGVTLVACDKTASLRFPRSRAG